MKYSCEEIEFMINEYCEQSKDYVVVKDVMYLLSKHLDIPYSSIKKTLVKNKSKYLFEIVGYINGKKISGWNLITSSKRYLNNIFTKIQDLNEDKLTYNEREYVLNCIQHELQLKYLNQN